MSASAERQRRVAVADVIERAMGPILTGADVEAAFLDAARQVAVQDHEYFARRAALVCKRELTVSTAAFFRNRTFARAARALPQARLRQVMECAALSQRMEPLTPARVVEMLNGLKDVVRREEVQWRHLDPAEWGGNQGLLEGLDKAILAVRALARRR